MTESSTGIIIFFFGIMILIVLSLFMFMRHVFSLTPSINQFYPDIGRIRVDDSDHDNERPKSPQQAC